MGFRRVYGMGSNLLGYSECRQLTRTRRGKQDGVEALQGDMYEWKDWGAAGTAGKECGLCKHWKGKGR